MRSLLPTTLILIPCTAFLQTPFIPEDPYNEPYSKRWTYLRNTGQVYDRGGTFREDVFFHSVGTKPTIFAMAANTTAMVLPVLDTTGAGLDTLVRLDLSFVGELASDPEPIVWDEIGGHYNFGS